MYIPYLCRYLLFYTVLRTFLVIIPIFFPNEGHSTHIKYGTKLVLQSDVYWTVHLVIAEE